ncbi:hypothetical protein [Pantoea anthophila]|uniref:hypothetical protein n=1 Tax=Pantoea anthophila TaxID=470931 RepID=UPI000614CD97|nr:hypothetical protein [Pantoea anthophila]KKB06625.1 hypothetical protein TN98_00965 [Pantoea anthophila]
MREINEKEIAAVSGAGLPEFLGNVNNALTDVSDLLDSTLTSLKESTAFGETLSLSFRALGLNVAKSFLTAFSGFLTTISA